MTQENSLCEPCVQVIVVANEKGGSGKSTVAVHLAVALIKSGLSVATIDLDSRQRSFTNYIENRLAWGKQRGKDLPTPAHLCFDEDAEFPTAQDADAAREELTRTIENLTSQYRFVVIDTAGHNHFLSQFAHSKADILITPLNDSFIDLDVLANVDPQTFGITAISHYAQTVEAARHQRRSEGKSDIDWIVLRNRLSMLASRNKRFVGDALGNLSQQLRFRCIEGLAERVIFREFYPRGLTALDELEEGTLGVRPTMSHVAAQMEVQAVLRALLACPATRADGHAARAA
jgi:chromosome partitioning protein